MSYLELLDQPLGENIAPYNIHVELVTQKLVAEVDWGLSYISASAKNGLNMPDFLALSSTAGVLKLQESYSAPAASRASDRLILNQKSSELYLSNI